MGSLSLGEAVRCAVDRLQSQLCPNLLDDLRQVPSLFWVRLLLCNARKLD